MGSHRENFRARAWLPVERLSQEAALVELIPRGDVAVANGRSYETSWTGPYVEAHLMTDVGLKREKNEDSCMLSVPDDEATLQNRGILLAVADGMGGASAGERASRMALNVIREEYYSAEGDSVPVMLRYAIEVANEKIFEEAEVNPLYSGMGTTVSAAVLHGGYVYIAQVGDSRVYLIRERGNIHQITLDHSLVAEQVRSGLLREEDARNHSLKNLITRAVGIKDTVRVDLYALKVVEHDTLLICSDGLSNIVTDDRISRALSNGNLRHGTESLIEQALNGGGPDNITALTVRITQPPPKTDLQPGAEVVDLTPSSFLKRLRRLFS